MVVCVVVVGGGGRDDGGVDDGDSDGVGGGGFGMVKISIQLKSNGSVLGAQGFTSINHTLLCGGGT